MDLDDAVTRDTVNCLQVDFNENSNALVNSKTTIYANSDEISAKCAFPMDRDLATTTTTALEGQSQGQGQGQGQDQDSNESNRVLNPDPSPSSLQMTTMMEDTLNNDFFYDDEFTIPFDANLTEDSRDLLPTPDVDSLLQRILPDVVDGNRDVWRDGSHMALSKSDSCLYQADQELSDSEREMSTSEHDRSSASNNSPLENRSLFSSYGDQQPATVAVDNGEDVVGDNLLSGSLNQDADRYNYERSKQQYVLLFDRSPTKTCSSEEDSCHQMATSRSRITSWSKSKSGKQRQRRTTTTRADDSPHPIIDDGAAVTKGEREKVMKSSSLVTWGQIKQNQVQSKPNLVAPVGLTTWQQVKKSQTMNSFSSSSTFGRSMQGAGGGGGEKNNAIMTVPEETSPRKMNDFVEDVILEKTVGSVDVQNCGGKLLDIYCRFKSQQEDEEEMHGCLKNEAMASPPTHEKLLEIWTGSSVVPGYERIANEKSNSKLSGIVGEEHEGDELSSSSVAVERSWIGAVSDDLDSVVPNRARTTSEQAGSPTVTSCLLRGRETSDRSVQFPPASVDRSVQTSIEFSENRISPAKENRSQQTSVYEAVKFTHGSFGGKVATTISSSSSDCKMMIRSAHLLNRPLPDLSFLKKSAKFQESQRCDGARFDAVSRTNGTQTTASSVGSTESHDATTNTTSQRRRIVDEEYDDDDDDEEEEDVCGFRKALFRCRSADVKASSSSDSRESSPRPIVYRHRSRSSDSTYSVCSTSSSGIDPGFSDSAGSGVRAPRHSRFYGAASEECRSRTESPTSESRNVPPKPPRSFSAGANETATKLRTETSEDTIGSRKRLVDDVRIEMFGETMTSVGGTCYACQSKKSRAGEEDDYVRALASSQPVYRYETTNERNSLKQVDYLQVSPTHSRARAGDLGGGCSLPPKIPSPEDRGTCHVGVARQSSPRHQRAKVDHVALRGTQSQQCLQQTTKPAKSILVRRRQRNLAKHRSWSTPPWQTDVDEAATGQRHGSYLAYLAGGGGGERRPISLPDENLLHQTQSNVVEEVEEEEEREREDEAKTEFVRQSVANRAASETALRSVERKLTDETADDEDVDDCERFRAKKSVSFSEKIFYHSSHSTSASMSPIESPKCPQGPQIATTTTLRFNEKDSTTKDCKVGVVDLKSDNAGEESDTDDTPPTDFMVSPNMSPVSSLLNSEVSESTDLLQKKELVLDVMRAVEVLVKHFSQTRDPTKKVQLGSTSDNGEIGRLVLEHLCPAIHAVVFDGLKPHVNSFFGKVKNSTCKVMEDSAEFGQPVELIQGLVKSLKSLKFLNTPWLLFNAFILGLLNYKAMDFWLTYIHNHKTLLSKHYSSSALIHLNNSSAHRLFLDMITSLQPLAQMPFRLEYNYETRMLDRRRQEQLAEYLLDRHVSRSTETYIEGQQMMTQLQNLSDSQQAQLDDGLLRRRKTEGGARLTERTRELIQKTGHHLAEKLSRSGERLTNESVTLVRSVVRVAVNRRPRPLSLPNAFQTAEDEYEDDARRHDLPVMTTSSLMPLGSAVMVESVASGGSTSRMAGSSDSSSDSDIGGFLERFARQLKDIASRQRKVYKTGVTDYSFENLANKDEAAKTLETGGTTSEKVAENKATGARTESEAPSVGAADVSADDAGEDTRLAGQGQAPRLKDDRQSVNGVKTAEEETSRPEASTVENELQTSADTASALLVQTAVLDGPAIPLSHTKKIQNVSLSSSRMNDSTSKKRWSDFGFGTRLVNIFDRLLLSDSSKATSSTFVKCQSMGHIDQMIVLPSSQSPPASAVNSNRAKLKQWSISMQGSHFLKNPRLDSAGNQTSTTDGEPTAGNLRYARTLCHYVAADKQQLSFEKGTLVAVQKDPEADWILCRLGKHNGLIHKACIRMVEIQKQNSLE